MSILTDNLWPKDIPESGRLIALFGMVQIMEDDMSKFNVRINNALLLLDSALEQIETGFVRCDTCGEQEDTKDLDFVEEIKEARSELLVEAKNSKKDKEIERLNGLVAMQHKFIEDHETADNSCAEYPSECISCGERYGRHTDNCELVSILSASSDTVSAYKRDLQAEILHKADVCPDCLRKKAHSADDCCKGYCSKWYAIRDKECAEECSQIASELRAKGE